MEKRFQTLDRLEAAEEIDIRAWLREMAAIHMRRPARERAYKIVKLYFSTEETNRETHRAFMTWLTNGYEEEAKTWALDRYMEETQPLALYDKKDTLKTHRDEAESAGVATLVAVN